MTEVRCDKCKKLITEGGAIISIVTDFVTSKRIDLCEECTKELKHWIYGEK